MNSFESFVAWIKRNKKKSILIAVVLFLIITKPSVNDYKKIRRCDTIEDTNFFIVSIYECKSNKIFYKDIAIAGNIITTYKKETPAYTY